MLQVVEEAMEIKNAIRTDKKNAEHYLLHYVEELKKFEEDKEEYLHYQENHDDNLGGGKGNRIGNPTAVIACKSIEFAKCSDSYRWLKAVEIVQRGLSERKNVFVKVRREAERNNLYTIGRGRKGWVIFVQQRYAEEMEKRFIIPEIWVAEVTIRRWWQKIINQTILVANKI